MAAFILSGVLAWSAGIPPFYAIAIPAFIVGTIATLVAFEASEAGFARDRGRTKGN